MMYETLHKVCSALCRQGRCNQPGGCLLDLQYDLQLEKPEDEDREVLIKLKKEYKNKDKYDYPCLVFSIKQLRELHKKGAAPRTARRTIELLKENKD